MQTAHALADFAIDHPGIFKEWRQNSAYLCCLQVPNISNLFDLVRELTKLKIEYSCMFESDLKGQLTAVAVQPLPRELHKKLFAKLKLAGSEQVKT